jgi:hypothetical protein
MAFGLARAVAAAHAIRRLKDQGRQSDSLVLVGLGIEHGGLKPEFLAQALKYSHRYLHISICGTIRAGRKSFFALPQTIPRHVEATIRRMQSLKTTAFEVFTQGDRISSD